MLSKEFIKYLNSYQVDENDYKQQEETVKEIEFKPVHSGLLAKEYITVPFK